MNLMKKVWIRAGKQIGKQAKAHGFRGLLFFVLVIFSGAVPVIGALAGERRLFLLRGDSLYIIDSSSGALLNETSLQGHPNIIHPTPGGKYVFVLNAENGLGQALDFENPQSARKVDISHAAPLASIKFSPLGDILYALSQDSGRVSTYKHKAGNLQYNAEFTIDGASFSADYGRIALNTRGTRLYSSTNNDLKFITVSDRAVVESLSGLGGDYAWKMAPGGRMLWGAGKKGWQVVDVSKKKLKAEFKGNNTSLPDFDTKGRHAWALDSGGRELSVFHVRRNKELARISLPEAALGLGIDGNEGVWLAAEGGLYNLKNLDKSEREVRRISNLPGSGKVFGFVSVELKSGMGFACF